MLNLHISLVIYVSSIIASALLLRTAFALRAVTLRHINILR
jgi:hypothetical protein